MYIIQQNYPFIAQSENWNYFNTKAISNLELNYLVFFKECTVFQKLKIPLLKAFGMSFRLAVKKKGMSTTELAREFSINQKSSWLFKRKAQEAMKSSGKHPLDSKVEVDELLLGGPEKGKRGRNKGEKKLVVIAKG